MYCPKCGKQIPDGSTSCSSCGATFQQTPTQAGPGPYQPYQQGPAQGQPYQQGPVQGQSYQQGPYQGQPQQTQSTGNGGGTKKPIFGLSYWLTIGLALLGMLLWGGILGLLCCIPVLVG